MNTNWAISGVIEWLIKQIQPQIDKNDIEIIANSNHSIGMGIVPTNNVDKPRARMDARDN